MESNIRREKKINRKNSSKSSAKIKIPEWLLFSIISVILGVVWYLILYGRFSLYFTHVNWIYSTGRDPLQHQLGWEFFRNEPWRFPLGTIKAYGYPVGTSVTFMDSIPLYAFLFKLLSPLLGQNFQYLGLWELNSIIGQLFVGYLIFREFTKSKTKMMLGASLLVLSPPMIYRAFFHNSLSAHWLILLAILFVILEYRQKMKSWYWIILFGLAMLIHLYYIPMLLPIWAISLIFRFRRDRKKILFILEPIKIVGVILVVGFCTGIFGLNTSALSQVGFGEYSWNLNGFFNSFGFSKFNPSLPNVEGQEEGFSYLGVGNYLVLAVALIIFFIKDAANKNWKFFLPFVLISIIYIMYSLSNKALLNTTVLWDIKFQEPVMRIFDLFRSSGRFIWPLFYLIVLFGIITLIRNFRFVAIPLLLIALVVQYFDLAPLYKSKQVIGFREYSAKLDEDFWRQAGLDNERIVIIPPEYYETLAIYAVRHEMTISAGYFGRNDLGAIEQYSQSIWEQLLAGQSDNKTIYVLSQTNYLEMAKENLTDMMVICEMDDYNVMFSTDNGLAKSDLLKKRKCSMPKQP